MDDTYSISVIIQDELQKYTSLFGLKLMINTMLLLAAVLGSTNTQQCFELNANANMTVLSGYKANHVHKLVQCDCLPMFSNEHTAVVCGNDITSIGIWSYSFAIIMITHNVILINRSNI